MNMSILYEKRDKIAYVTLNRPEALNAMDGEMFNRLTEIWMDARDDPGIEIVIVTGAGDKAFSTGMDLKWAAKQGNLELPWIMPMRGLEIWKPVIAAINGYAVGGGLELALSCDIRIAAEHAMLGLQEVKWAIIPGAGGTQRLPRLIPFGIALEMLLTGRLVSAQEGYRLGLVNKVVPAGQVMSAAEAVAQEILENGPLAVRAAKEAAYRGIEMPLNEGLRLEHLLLLSMNYTEDSKEGPRAFAEKRKPVYRGK